MTETLRRVLSDLTMLEAVVDVEAVSIRERIASVKMSVNAMIDADTRVKDHTWNKAVESMPRAVPRLQPQKPFKGACYCDLSAEDCAARGHYQGVNGKPLDYSVVFKVKTMPRAEIDKAMNAPYGNAQTEVMRAVKVLREGVINAQRWSNTGSMTVDTDALDKVLDTFPVSP